MAGADCQWAKKSLKFASRYLEAPRYMEYVPSIKLNQIGNNMPFLQNCLQPLQQVLKNNSQHVVKSMIGQAKGNRFDPFGMNVKNHFEFGDLHVECHDRYVIVEIESSGGLTNLVEYWPIQVDKPILL